MDKSIIKKYRAEFENACDDLYYGYGYKFWRTHNNSIEDDNIAKMVWKAAFDKMSQNESKKNTLKLTESEIKNVIMESVKRILKEDYAGNYEELIKEEMHRLYELEQNVPQWIQSDIHNMVVTMQSILQEIQRNRDFDNWK